MKALKTSLLVTAATSVLMTSAYAGGFSTEGINPGGALFNEKSFVIQGGIAYVNPLLEYRNATGSTQLGAPVTTDSKSRASDSYTLIDVDIKAGIGDSTDCAFRGHEPWKLRNTVDKLFNGRFEQSKFFISSLGLDLTCSYTFAYDEMAQIRILGGLRSTSIDAVRNNAAAGGAILGGKVDAWTFGGVMPVAANEHVNQYDLSEDDRGYGYRIGAAYEIPQYLLRAQVIYDSGIDVDLKGTNHVYDAVTGATVYNLPVETSVRLPQSISARFQSAINTTTLLWGGVKWQNWGDIKMLTLVGKTGVGDVDEELANTITTNWNDGWTVEAGAAKKITKDLSLQGRVTWNEGIGGGYTDTWAFGLGAAYDIDDNWRVSVGGSATYITSSTEVSTGAGAGASASRYNQGSDWAFAAGVKLQYAVK